jgi:hypothetical protein
MLSLLRSFFFALFFCCAAAIQAQSLLETRFDGTEMGKTLTVVLHDIESKHHGRFYFNKEWIESIVIQDSYPGKTLAEVLDVLFAGTDLTYLSPYPQVVIILHDPTQAIVHRQALLKAVSERKKIERMTFGRSGKGLAKGKITVSGTVIDLKTDLPLAGANIRLGGSATATSTDVNGKYSITIEPGSHILSFTFIDYEEKVIDLVAYEDASVNVKLAEIPVYLEEVVVEDRATREVSQIRIGQTQLSMKEIKRTPPMLGEVDLIRKVQMLPGVTTVGEAASGFNVRGGSVDQNLILYEGMPMFNSSHVFGFLSTFNAEAIRDVSFYRGGIPAEYGGRASSVLDIRGKEGNYEKWTANVGIGIITTNAWLSGPLKKGKTSLMASFRSTYSDWLIHTVKSDYGNLKKSKVFFLDGSAKLTHLFSQRTKLSVTGYSSHDSFRLLGDSTYRWKSTLVSARLDHQFTSDFTGDFTIGQSNYAYDLDYGDSTSAANLAFKINSTNARAGFNYQSDQHKINFGWQGTYYQLYPGKQSPTSEVSTANTFSLDKQQAIETAIYGADAWSVNERIMVEGGVRVPMFTQFGPATLNEYRPDVPRDVTTVTGTTDYGKGKPIKTYFGIEPRLAFRWMLTPTSSVKAAYSRVYQFLHLVSNSTAVSPIDIWQPSGKYFKPQLSDQWSVGYFRDLKENKYSVSGEVFYKTIQNAVDFKDGAQLILNRHIETELLQGKGWSYGLETTFSKNQGIFQASFNYTYSRSLRQFAGPTDEESINFGKVYPSNFDQPHIINFNWKVNITKRHLLTGNWTYHTGRPITIPIAGFIFDNTPVSYFTLRNQYRVPDYHRLDIALVVEGTHRRKKLGDGTWVFALYNAYARKNVYTVFFRSSPSGITRPYRLAIIGTILPSISYNVKF